jgi:hypothetical protein
MTPVDGEELLRIIGAGLRGAPLVLPTPTWLRRPAAPDARCVVGTWCDAWLAGGPRAGAEFFGCALSGVPRHGAGPGSGGGGVLTQLRLPGRWLPEEPLGRLARLIRERIEDRADDNRGGKARHRHRQGQCKETPR